MKIGLNKRFVSRSHSGFTLVEIMIVVAIIGLLAVMALPNFARARVTSQTNACINNLRQLDSAIQQFALENNIAPASAVDGDDIAPYLPRGINTSAADIENIVFCPIDPAQSFSGSYAAGLSTVDTPPLCTLGDGLTPAHALP
jgi:prepilin-type N-terminal cleavage/methylation domain-containing protein